MRFKETILFLICFSLSITISSGANTISANQSLSGDQTIISEGEQFELGFFKAGNTSNYYIGIWYNKLNSNPPTIVWVANRETPISDRFRSELKIINGNLVLLNESKSQIWSTNVIATTTTLKSAEALILDNGNLVLRDGSNSVEPVWQSFDNPTHTWLPGMFSVELRPSSKEYVIKWNGSQQYWTTGNWNGKSFDLIPQLSLTHNYDFRQFGLTSCHCLTGFKPRSENDWNQSDFSVKNMPPNNSVAIGNAGECRTTCLNDCLCEAYSFDDTQCSIWNGDLLNLSEDDVSGNEIYIKVDSKDVSHPNKSNLVKVEATVGVVVGVVFVLGLIFVLIYRKKRVSEGKATMEGSLVAFVYKDLKIATKNFSEKLGGGGFGSVFKGRLRDLSIVAVKRLEGISQGEKQFRSEVSTIGTIQHVNIVRLRGFFVEGGDVLNLLDSMLNGEASDEEVTKVCKIACRCIQYEEESRPSMSQVEQMLEGVLDVNMPPIPNMRKRVDPVVFSTESPSNESSQIKESLDNLRQIYYRNIPYHDHTSSSSWSNTTAATLSPNTSETTTHESKLESSRPLQGGFGWLSGNSLVVEKNSNDPYVDFRESMLQMIMENEIYGKDELRELLNCFLQLNSPYYHGVIVGAFTSEGFNCSTISSQLYNVNLSLNSLTGYVPVSLSQSNSLMFLSLQFNNFSGVLPDSWGGGKNDDKLIVKSLTFDHNLFTGNLLRRIDSQKD
ncbi:hypothetical protein LXL04_025449 [Taraxacum kok-saghyz]